MLGVRSDMRPLFAMTRLPIGLARGSDVQYALLPCLRSVLRVKS